MSSSPGGARPGSIPPLALALGDACTLLAFVLIGVMSHANRLTWTGVARNAVPILGLWFLCAPFMRTYRRPGLKTLLPTWAVAVTGGILIRELILGREADQAFFLFLGVGLATTLAMLLAWRSVAWAVGRTLSARGADPAGPRVTPTPD